MDAERVVEEIQGGHNFSHPAAKEKVHKPKTFLIRSQVKKYALDVSKRKRAGKFTRMSEAFFISCEAEMEGRVRALQLHDTEPVSGAFVTGHCVNMAKEKLNQAARAIVHGKVMKHPTLGVTLMGG
jgi:hypothetical protein